jgi:hypothetical protein
MRLLSIVKKLNSRQSRVPMPIVSPDSPELASAPPVNISTSWMMSDAMMTARTPRRTGYSEVRPWAWMQGSADDCLSR